MTSEQITSEQITSRIEAIYVRVEQQLRLPDGVEEFAALARWHEAEASCWRELTESSRTRLCWLSAIAAGERARGLAEHWAGRAHGSLLEEGQAA